MAQVPSKRGLRLLAITRGASSRLTAAAPSRGTPPEAVRHVAFDDTENASPDSSAVDDSVAGDEVTWVLIKPRSLWPGTIGGRAWTARSSHTCAPAMTVKRIRMNQRQVTEARACHRIASQRQKQYADSGRRDVQFKADDWVLLSSKNLHFKGRTFPRQSKLRPNVSWGQDT
ncbi:hypothetical protein WJX75_001166 [Coccomyxa subellipsoidea]|uniref:Uncharacterized protein n=1 Tax=Coccomyxa subellipsoidea TaxID=248742 RepID=A0ABR2YAL8_9CHLO